MTAEELDDIRRRAGMTQADFAAGLGGLTAKTYQSIMARAGDIDAKHAMLAERFALSIAVERKDPMLATAAVRREALELARLITG